MVVRCLQKELGCDWEGELGQLKSHLNPGAGVVSSMGCHGGMCLPMWCPASKTIDSIT